MDDFIVCQNCGEKNPIESNYCNKCATPLKIVYRPPVQPSYYEKPRKEKSFRLVTDNGISAIGCLILVIIILIILFLSGAFGHFIIFS